MEAIYPKVITLKNTRKWKPENGNQKMETRKCKPLRVKWKLSTQRSLH